MRRNGVRRGLSGHERRAERPYIVADHVDVSGRGTLFVGQGVGVKGPSDFRPGLLGNPLPTVGL